MTSPKPIHAPVLPAKRHMFFVLGMHRSGTSAMSGLLAGVGAKPPQTLMQATDHNPKGYFESQRIFRFNDRVLKAFGSSWHDWRDMPPAWVETEDGQAFLTEAVNLLNAEFPEGPLAVFKDPRVCRMMPFWTRAAKDAGFSVLPVLIHRNPLEVAQSLEERNGMPTAEGLMIWLQHVLAAEYATRKTQRYVTSYSQVLKDWQGQVAAIQEAFGIALDPLTETEQHNIDSFITPNLRHFSKLPESVSERADVSDWVRTTFDILERWAIEGEDKSSYKSLNRVRLELEKATPPLFQLLSAKEQKLRDALQDSAEQLKRAEAKTTEVTADLQAEQSRTKNLAASVDALNQNLAEVTATLEERDTEILELRGLQHGVMTELLVRINETFHENDRLKKNINSVESELANKAKEAASLRKKLAAMKTSTSWRMTKPIRKMVRIVRGKS